MKGKKAAFADEYKKDRNATQAAIRAGYSEKTAAAAGSRLLKDKEVAEELKAWEKKLHEERTADVDEVIEFFTAVMRGETPDNIPLLVGKGKQKITEIGPSVRDRLNAAVNLGKTYAMFDGKHKNEEDENGIKNFLDAISPSVDELNEVFDDEE